MMIQSLQKVLCDTADLDSKDIGITELSKCLQPARNDIPSFSDCSTDNLWQLSLQYFHVLKEFQRNGLIQRCSAVSNEEIINLKDQNNFVGTIDRVRQFTLNLYLPRELRALSKCETKLFIQLEEPERVRRLIYCVEQFRALFQTKLIALQVKLEDCIMDFLAGLYACDHITEPDLELFPREHVFRCLLVIKGSQNPSLELSKRLHVDLLRLTGEPGGFQIFCRTLLSGKTSDEAPVWRKSAIIAKIVGSRGHTKRFYKQILDDCFVFFESILAENVEENLIYRSACIECLKQVYQLPAAYRELREKIENYFLDQFHLLIEPKEMITGYIVIEKQLLVAKLRTCVAAFSGSSCSSLPSSMLVPYVKLFLKLYSLLPVSAEERSYLQILIVFCLSNRTKEELQTSITQLLEYKDENEAHEMLHSRILLKYSEDNVSYSFQIGPSNEQQEECSLLPVLIEIAKTANRNLLIYDIFIILLNYLSRLAENSPNSANVLLDPGEQQSALWTRFNKQYTVIHSLMELVSHKPFHSQLYENSREVLQFIKSSIVGAIESNTLSEHIVEIVLAIFQEYLHRLQRRNDIQEIVVLLKRYQTLPGCSEQIKRQIDCICKESHQSVSERSPYETAIDLCADREAYCKVYGTTLLIRLIQERDVVTVSNKHAVLIVALDNLRSEESYAFLNSVRLLVALCYLLEADVVDALVREYQSADNSTDYRLKLGEATIKTVETLGPFAIKHRDVLLNCFLTGMRSTIDEIRSSSLANLGAICRILAYQVHHFFYEMFLGISAIVTSDQYLPARRAGILVLTQLIDGMDNLLTFQEYLLPIYRFLKHTINVETDDTTRLQAAVALDHLKVKTKDFLSNEASSSTDRLEKEIRIFGIKDERERMALDRCKNSGNTILTKMLD